MRERREKAENPRQTKCSSQKKRPRKSDQELFPIQKPGCKNSQNPLFASSEPTKGEDTPFCPEKRSALHQATQRAAMADAARCDGTCSRVRLKHENVSFNSPSVRKTPPNVLLPISPHSPFKWQSAARFRPSRSRKVRAKVLFSSQYSYFSLPLHFVTHTNIQEWESLVSFLARKRRCSTKGWRKQSRVF